MTEPQYPRSRETHGLHAMRFTKAIFAAEVPKRCGADATLLVLFIASEEHRLFYSVAPAYWIKGIKDHLGFGGNDRLYKAIQTAQEAGLLHYGPSQHTPSSYWTLIPTWLVQFYIIPESGMITPDSGTEHSWSGNESGNESRKHSTNVTITKTSSARNQTKFTKPTLEEVKAYCKERGNRVDPQHWYDHYEANGWRVGRTAMKNWRAAIRTWEQNGIDNRPATASEPEPSPYKSFNQKGGTP